VIFHRLEGAPEVGVTTVRSQLMMGATLRAPLYEKVMQTPRGGFAVCRDCFNLTRGFERCYACASTERVLDAVVPISYSVGGESLNGALAGYKRLGGPLARRLAADLAVILERFLVRHEACLARACGIEEHLARGVAGKRTRSTCGLGSFDLVTTVPSSDRQRDERHPLRWIVGELASPTADRHQRLLRRSQVPFEQRRFDRHRYEPTRALSGERVLLVDDTWTTGASAQSAAAALRDAGASSVAAVVIGRHLNRAWHENDVRLRTLAHPFEWSSCAVCISGQHLERDGHQQRAA
jgi:hypothetical protein